MSSPHNISFKLYLNVENMPEIRQKIQSEFQNCCLIKPKLIYDPFQVKIAINKALNAEKLTTKCLPTEILFNLSISKNISGSLREFGVSDVDTDVLIVIVNQSAETIEKIAQIVKGDEVSLENGDELAKIRDLESIRKTYKIKETEGKCSDILDSIVTRIATKDFVSI